MFGYENKAIDYTQQTIQDEKQNSPNLFTGKLCLGKKSAICHVLCLGQEGLRPFSNNNSTLLIEGPGNIYKYI